MASNTFVSTDKAQNLSESDINQIFKENKHKLKSVIDEYHLNEESMSEQLVTAVRDYEENTGEKATKDDVIELMLDENNQWE
jgi:hypothetical protein